MDREAAIKLTTADLSGFDVDSLNLAAKLVHMGIQKKPETETLMLYYAAFGRLTAEIMERE